MREGFRFYVTLEFTLPQTVKRTSRNEYPRFSTLDRRPRLFWRYTHL